MQGTSRGGCVRLGGILKTSLPSYNRLQDNHQHKCTYNERDSSTPPRSPNGAREDVQTGAEVTKDRRRQALGEDISEL